jgi:hypothetical protein
VTKPDVDLALAEAAVFFTKALCFDRFALHACVFFGSSSAGAHSTSLAPVAAVAKVPEVTTSSFLRGCLSAFASIARRAVKGFLQPLLATTKSNAHRC